MLLSIDTSSSVCLLSLGQAGTFHYRISEESCSHSQVLLMLIQELLSEAHIQLKDLSGIAVVNGPGSFVGVRLGVSVAQGLAYALGSLVWPLSGLQILAQSALRKFIFRDAHMGEMYTGEYECDAKAIMRPLRPDAIEALIPDKLSTSNFLASPKALHQIAWEQFSTTPGLKPEALAPLYLKGANLWKATK